MFYLVFLGNFEWECKVVSMKGRTCYPLDYAYLLRMLFKSYLFFILVVLTFGYTDLSVENFPQGSCSVSFEQIADALYYNSSLTLSILHKLGVATEVFNLWFQMLQQVKKNGLRVNFKRWLLDLLCSPPPSRLCLIYFSCWQKFECVWKWFLWREHDKKVCCLGLTSLLALTADQLPGEALGRVFRATLDLLVAYKEQVAGLSLSLILVPYYLCDYIYCLFMYWDTCVKFYRSCEGWRGRRWWWYGWLPNGWWGWWWWWFWQGNGCWCWGWRWSWQHQTSKVSCTGA